MVTQKTQFNEAVLTEASTTKEAEHKDFQKLSFIRSTSDKYNLSQEFIFSGDNKNKLLTLESVSSNPTSPLHTRSVLINPFYHSASLLHQHKIPVYNTCIISIWNVLFQTF